MPAAVAPVQAAAAYRAALAPEAPAEGAGFGAALQRAVEGAVEIGHSADAASTGALLGQGSVSDVVLAVSRAELALQTAVAVRDRVVSAYQDIMRMPI
ncbi:flagellar hook-basal body complex protein FliE [Belnapia sp. T6]|uniref:Flagellar hook-basal body complex protein FliE n=1 Tax=Belnapia mucosa TaxID=2804532 RepID=A0ABS1UXD4_9PROT|nr:flagellar hook-basal body complex protein FliE [Belnapia mucosa]MBL6454126.1 flagellar hook-basal body complex protein FliE [Belnapia mucosa]